MYDIARTEERNELFINTASKMGIDSAIVEKDFWVCLTLDYLFNRSKWKNSFIFKGGTSLSKVYRIIERFSEDIDLILDWRTLGYQTDEPWIERSNTKQLKFIDESRNRLFKFLNDEFVPCFKKDMESILNKEINIYVSNDDPGTVNFEYPNYHENKSILKMIRLEIGALAAWEPSQKATIKPYVAAYYPKLFKISETEIKVTTIERTFWEKVTILHQEAFRPETSLIPGRYSRHYYDVYCMVRGNVQKKAFDNPELLIKVAEFKNKFYPRGWARYDQARIGTLRLYPAKHSIPELRKDYAKMKNMIYGYYPDFNEILDCIKMLEKEINIRK